jgi:hypothetical protein
LSSNFPWEALRLIIVRASGLVDDYVTVDGAPEAVVQPNYSNASLTCKVRICPRRSARVGTGRPVESTTLETLGGKQYRVKKQSGHEEHGVDITVESFDTQTNAGDVAREIGRALEDEARAQEILEAGLSIAIIRDVVEVDFHGGTQMLSAANLELQIYHKWERLDRTARELIETVEITRA